jgi:hypothetical protein
MNPSIHLKWYTHKRHMIWEKKKEKRKRKKKHLTDLEDAHSN